MYRRLFTICLLWLSLSGLASAAGCVVEMAIGDRADVGCTDHAPANTPQLECCTLDALAGPPAATQVEAPKKIELGFVSIALAFEELEQALARTAARDSPPPPLILLPSDASLWLTTARLRL